MRAMSGFSGDLIYININYPTPGGLVEIKSPLLLPYPHLTTPGFDYTRACAILFRILLLEVCILRKSNSPPYPAPRGYLLNQNPTMSPLCPAGGVVGTDIDRCIKLTVCVCVSVPAVTAQRLQCDES